MTPFPMLLRRLLPFLLCVLWGAGGLPVPAQAEDEDPEIEVPDPVPVKVTLTLDESQVQTTGRWRLHVKHEVLEDLQHAFRVELRLRHAQRDLVPLDHAPQPPTATWRKGQVIEYDLPIPVPTLSRVEPGASCQLLLGFHHLPTRHTVPVTSDEPSFLGRTRLLRLEMPTLEPTDDPAIRDGMLAASQALVDAGKPGDAWLVLESGIRRAEEDDTKYAFRDAMARFGTFAPRPLSPIEANIVKGRIAREKQRWLRLMAGRFFDRGQLHAAYHLLGRLGGMLEEASGEAVIGAVGEAGRAQKDRIDIRVRILGDVSKEDRAAAQDVLDRPGGAMAQMDAAAALAKEGRLHVARLIYRGISTSGSEHAGAAREALEATDRALLDAIPPKQAAEIERVSNHPAFARLATVVSHEFVFIGPKGLVESIPPQSKLRFDIAAIFLTDLFGRKPNPGGDRVTVFYKELWDFGGGQGGGKIIDIGRANPEARGTRVDTGLLYHEFTHCVDDTNPILAGFREGLANFGAAYAFEALGQTGDSLHSFTANLTAFQQDYVNRHLPYWRIPGYGPSAGFFLHFVHTHSRKGRGHDWKPYRRFFREFRRAPVRDGREPYVARALAYYLVRAFGDKAFDDLRRFRFPLKASDREAVKLEMETFARGENAVAAAEEDFARFPNSPLQRDLWMRRLLEFGRSTSLVDEARRIGEERLGILYDWWVIGPFGTPGADPLACVLPPEHTVDFQAEYPGGNNVCRWRKAGSVPLVGRDPMGWVSFNFNYMDNTATYALCHVTVPAAIQATAHVRADDDFMLFVNDRLIDRYRNRGPNASTQFWWRGPYEKAPDAMRLSVPLQPGRNKVLVKVKNRWGTAGFTLALAQEDGRAIPGLTVDLDPPAPTPEPEEHHSSRWKNALKHKFTRKAFKSRFDVAVGAFEVKDDALIGTATDKRVGWRKYTVRPGFPKDSPSNLIWLKEKATKDLDGFRLRLGVRTNKTHDVPKLVLTFQGEGGTDGLSGWNLILHGRGRRLNARLERYDNLVYQVAGIELPKRTKRNEDEIPDLYLEFLHGRLHVTYEDVPVFSGVPLTSIPGRTRIGLSTYGPRVGITHIRLDRFKPPR